MKSVKGEFYKKFTAFCVAFCVCATVFLAVGVAVFVTERVKEMPQKAEAVEQPLETLPLKLVFVALLNGNDFYLTRVSFNFNTGETAVKSIPDKTVYSVGRSARLSEHYSRDGVSGLVLALESLYEKPFRFIIMNGEQIKTVVDHFGGVVTDGENNLMGANVLSAINSDADAENTVKSLLRSYLTDRNGLDERENFIFLSNNVNTDLTYMYFYNNWENIKNLSKEVG